MVKGKMTMCGHHAIYAPVYSHTCNPAPSPQVTSTSEQKLGIVTASWTQGGEESCILLEPQDPVVSAWFLPPLGQNLTSWVPIAPQISPLGPGILVSCHPPHPLPRHTSRHTPLGPPGDVSAPWGRASAPPIHAHLS